MIYRNGVATLKKISYSMHDWFRSFLERYRPLPETSPVVVYSMRKVGSTSVTYTLRNMGFTVYKQHCLNDHTRKCFRKSLGHLGEPAQHWLSDGAIFEKRLQKWRATNSSQGLAAKRLKLITFVRDPISIAVSDFFMQLFEFMPDQVEKNGLDDLVRLQELFGRIMCNNELLEPLEQFLKLIVDYPLIWFDDELKEVFDIDVFSKPFDRELGYGYFSTPDCDLLLMRSDLLDSVGASSLSQFLGTPIAQLQSKNLASVTSYGTLYSEFTNALSLPSEVVRKYFRKARADHFFSEKELVKLHEKWTQA